MPELPEVETTVLSLRHHFANERLLDWQALAVKLRRPIPEAASAKVWFGKQLKQIVRVAKSIYFDFGVEQVLHLHLGMTGFFIMPESGVEPVKHEHLRLTFASGKLLSFCDPRRFGLIEITKSPLPTQRVVEPFVGSLTSEYLTKACAKSRRSIKSLIMDQQIIAGIGNIYASEALFAAGIRPERAALSLNQAEIKALAKALRKVIKTAISAGLAQQKRNNWLLDAKTTQFELNAKVYGKTSEQCVQCQKEQIAAIKLAGRNSFYCPHCQK